MRLKTHKLQISHVWRNIFVAVTIFGALQASGNQPPEVKWALSHGFPRCQNIFHPNSDLLIPMMNYYVGEETGLVVDPLLTHSWAIKGHLGKSSIKDKWKVEYFDELTRKNFEVYPKDGKIYDFKGDLYDSKYDPVDLFYEESLFVVDKDFRFFILAEQERGRYHHSSLSAGDDVIFAGTISITKGQIREISANSGHYKPTAAQTLKVLKEFKKRGINLDSIKLHGQAAYELGHSHSLTAKEIKKLIEVEEADSSASGSE